VRGELVEQPADLVGGQRVVRETLERRQLLGANRRTAWRHLHLLVPAEQRRGAVEIVDLADALLQARKRRLHCVATYLAARDRVASLPRRRTNVK
jgi:hypothetical protein